MRIPTRCLAAKDSRAFRPQVRSLTIGTLYGTRDNGRSGDPVKILRRNYASNSRGAWKVARLFRFLSALSQPTLEARRQFFGPPGKQIAAKNTHRAFGRCPGTHRMSKMRPPMLGKRSICKSRPFLTSLRNGEAF